MRDKFLISIGLLVIAFASAHARAEDFTFTVPVEVSNLPPEINRGYVSCDLMIREPGRSERAAGNAGRPMFLMPPPGGSFRGDVVVAANAAAGVEPARVTHYKCWLVFMGTLRGAPVEYSFRDEGFGLPLPVAPGAPFVPRVAGAVR